MCILLHFEKGSRTELNVRYLRSDVRIVPTSVLSPHPAMADQTHYVLQPETPGQPFSFDAFHSGAVPDSLSLIDTIVALSHLSFLIATQPNFIQLDDAIDECDLVSHDNDPFTTRGWMPETQQYDEDGYIDPPKSPIDPAPAPSGVILGCSGEFY